MTDEAKQQCKEQVWDSNGWRNKRCTRSAVKDGYCKQHHPETVKERREESDKRYKEKMENSPLAKLRSANEKLQALEARCKYLEEAVRERDEWMQNTFGKALELAGYYRFGCDLCKVPGCPRQTHPLEKP